MISINKIINIIIEDIKTNFDPGYKFKIENFFGFEAREYERKFTQANSIYVIYDGAEYEKGMSFTMPMILSFTFVIVFQTVAVSKTKEDYLLDKFREFITWYNFDELNVEYATADVEPFFPEDERLITTVKGGVTLFAITGSISLIKRNIGG
jgi:hypothetical protein